MGAIHLAGVDGSQTLLHDPHALQRAGDLIPVVMAQVPVEFVQTLSRGMRGMVGVVSVEKLVTEGVVKRILHQFLSLGSRASRRPSPRKFTASTVIRIARPGKIVNQGLVDMVLWASCSMLPQLGVGGLTPRPRKLSEDSRMIAPPTPRVAPTMIGAIALGKIWRKTMRRSRSPTMREATMYSSSRMDSTVPRTTRAVGIQLSKPLIRIM